MKIRLHKDSHVDHGLSGEQVEYLLQTLEATPHDLTIQTVELPEGMGTVPCGLHGPVMGDDPVPDDEVTFAVRGSRSGASRLCRRPVRPTRKVTIISGPHEGHACVLFTAFGGPQAPREPFEDDSPESIKFWSEHALSREAS